MIDQAFKDIMIGGKGCAVIMAGSDSDEGHIDKIVESLNKYNVEHRVRVCSAHKQPDSLLYIINEYNDVGGSVAYVGVAGGTDALSGTLSYHAMGPVISCPPDTKYSGPQKPKKEGEKAVNKHTQELNVTCLVNPPGSSNAYVARPGNVGRMIAQIYCGVNIDFRNQLVEEKQKKINSLMKADDNFHLKYGGDKKL